MKRLKYIPFVFLILLLCTLATARIGGGPISGGTLACGDCAGTFQGLDADLTSLAGGITGLVKGSGDGGGYAAGVAGTDYYAPGNEDAIAAAISPGALPASSVYGSDILYGDGLTVSGSSLVLDLTDPHTWTGNQILPWLKLTAQSSAPFSSGDGTYDGYWWHADGVTWNPGGISSPTYGYYGIHYWDNPTETYIMNFDDHGTLHLSSITTTETEFIPISWMDITDGGADPPESLYSTDSNSREFKIATFDGATDENLSFVWSVPSDIVAASGFKYRWHGIVTNATGPSSEDISFQLSCISVADGEQLDFASYGSAVATTESSVTEAQDDLITSAWSSAVTATGLAAGEIVHCLLNRDADGNDTYAQDFGLIGIDIKYQRTHDTTF